MAGRPDRKVVGVIACAVLALALSAAATPAIWDSIHPGSDVGVYAGYGKAVVNGAVPYRDVFVDYPPGALIAIVPPALVTDSPSAYGDVFAATMLVVLALAIVVTGLTFFSLGMSTARTLLGLTPLALAPVLLGELVVQRFDAVPMLFTAIALLFLVRGHDVAAGTAAGLGAAVKFYPAALMVAVLVLAYRRGGSARCARSAAAFGAAFALVVVPFALVAPSALVEMLRYQLIRPLQLEALGSSVILALHAAAGVGVGLSEGYGSVYLDGLRGDLAGLFQTALFLGVLVWAVGLTLRRVTDVPQAVTSCAVVLCAFVALGRVLSPQYLVWLLPVVPLVGGASGAAATAVLLVALVLTRIWYPDLYFEVTGSLDPSGIAVLVARNALLLLLLAILVVELRRAGRHPAIGSAQL